MSYFDLYIKWRGQVSNLQRAFLPPPRVWGRFPTKSLVKTNTLTGLFFFSAATPTRFGCFTLVWRLCCQALATDGCLISAHSMRIDTRTFSRCSFQIFIVTSPASRGRGLSVSPLRLACDFHLVSICQRTTSSRGRNANPLCRVFNPLPTGESLLTKNVCTVQLYFLLL